MQQELYKSEFLIKADEYHKKSVHAEWSGKKAEARKLARLSGDFLVKSLENDNLEPEQKVAIYWRAVLLHQEVRRNKVALSLAQSALDYIKNSEINFDNQKNMFEVWLKH